MQRIMQNIIYGNPGTFTVDNNMIEVVYNKVDDERSAKKDQAF